MMQSAISKIQLKTQQRRQSLVGHTYLDLHPVGRVFPPTVQTQYRLYPPWCPLPHTDGTARNPEETHTLTSVIPEAHEINTRHVHILTERKGRPYDEFSLKDPQFFPPFYQINESNNIFSVKPTVSEDFLSDLVLINRGRAPHTET